jgi:hypothetical protein
MTKLAHPFFGGSHLLPEPLSRAIDDAADLAEGLARLNPDHELLDLFVDFGPDHQATLEVFWARFARPGATATERSSVEGQTYFWQRYAEALEAALREDSAIAQDPVEEVIARYRFA